MAHFKILPFKALKIKNVVKNGQLFPLTYTDAQVQSMEESLQTQLVTPPNTNESLLRREPGKGSRCIQKSYWVNGAVFLGVEQFSVQNRCSQSNHCYMQRTDQCDSMSF